MLIIEPLLRAELPMPYAIIQRELATPEPAVLAKAFGTLPILTAMDAQTAARDAFGILMRGLDLENASRLQDALFKHDIGVEVAEETELPIVPPSKVIRQIELLPSNLRLFDPMNRSFSLAWSDILLICAGNVRLQEFKRSKVSLEEPQFMGAGISYDTVSDARTREESRFHLLLEIVLSGGVGRYSVTADEFDFNYLAARRTPSLAENFSLLVSDIAQAAPHAGLNRGAFLLCEGNDGVFAYPSKAAFYEEMVWLLWRTAQAAAEA